MHALTFARPAALIAMSALVSPGLAASAPDPRCAIFGEGFSYVESIGSCVRIGGLVRADAGVGHGHGSSRAGIGSAAQLSVEVNRQTELGPFRAVIAPRAGLFDNELR